MKICLLNIYKQSIYSEKMQFYVQKNSSTSYTFTIYARAILKYSTQKPYKTVETK